jgi:hypothetical protein
LPKTSAKGLPDVVNAEVETPSPMSLAMVCKAFPAPGSAGLRETTDPLLLEKRDGKKLE